MYLHIPNTQVRLALLVAKFSHTSHILVRQQSVRPPNLRATYSTDDHRPMQFEPPARLSQIRDSVCRNFPRRASQSVHQQLSLSFVVRIPALCDRFHYCSCSFYSNSSSSSVVWMVALVVVLVIVLGVVFEKTLVLI